MRSIPSHLAPMTPLFDRILEAQEFLGKNREDTQSPKEKELFLLAIDALWFIWKDGRANDFEG